MSRLIAVFATLLVMLLAAPVIADSQSQSTITRAEIFAAQKAWADGVIAIGKAYTSGGDYKALAENHVATLYGYDLGPVLFKPTKASHDQFRENFEQAVSYFVGGIVTEDKGFALTPWVDIRFVNAGMYLHGDMAIAMGSYFFTDPKGKESRVSYSFGYLKTKDGKLMIVAHHSSMPYRPE